MDSAIAPRLQEFERLLRERAIPLGFVAKGDAERLAERHVLDSLRAAPLVPSSARSAYDLGSGAGLPGVVLALALPDLHVILVEAQERRAGFLEYAVSTLGLANADVHVGRAEDLRDPVDVCLARAFGPLEPTWSMARRLLHPGGTLIHFMGARRAAVARLPGVAALEKPATSFVDSSAGITILVRE